MGDTTTLTYRMELPAVARLYADNILNEPAIPPLLRDMADEVERLRLTDEEFGAVAYGRELIREWHAGDDPKGRDAILRGLLERHRATSTMIENTQDQRRRTKEAAHMSDTNERSVASAGSVAGEPVAWAAFVNGVLDLAFKSQADAFMWAYKRDGIEIVSLYRQPQPTLTDAEREAISGVLTGRNNLVIHEVWEEEWKQNCDTLRGLLERMK